MPRFQSILSNSQAPFCNRLCTRTYEQDQWRDKLFTREKEALDGWRYCYKTKAWESRDRSKPWLTQQASSQMQSSSTLLPPIMPRELGSGCGSRNSQPFAADGVSFNDGIKQKRNLRSSCGPCDLYQQHMKQIETNANKAGLSGSVSHPQFFTPQGRLMREAFCERLDVLEKLNKRYMSRAPSHALEGVLQELGELPIVTLHKIQQKKEDASGKFYPEDRGLAEVCNPIGGSYMTARPFRCHPTYRYCEPVNAGFTGHVPGEQFLPGETRGRSTRNATKYMTYRV